MPIKKPAKNLRIAIIGCGGFGNFHLDNLLKMEGIEIVALCNRGIEKLEKTGKKAPSARMYQDVETMLSKEKLDAAIISLIPAGHGKVEELCCKKGIHMLVEKPIEIDLKRAEEISESIRLSSVITSVGYQERYSEPLELVREILQKETVGLVQGSWIGGMPGPKWWRTKKESGGQLVEQATHIVDIFRYLFGEVESVYASGRRDKRFEGMGHDVEDYSTAVLTFQNGITASLQTGCYATGDASSKVGFEIYTPRCCISYTWGKSLKVSYGERSEEIQIMGDTHIPCLESFIYAVKTGDRIGIRSTYEDALETLRVTLKANQSMETGQAMQIYQTVE